MAYDYDAGGLRVRSQAGSNAPIFYIFDGSTLLGEVQASGSASNVQAVYTWGANGLVSERVFASNGGSVGMSSSSVGSSSSSGNGRSLWYAYDVQGATRVLTDANGHVVDTYQYLPYGTLLAQSGADPNPFRYGGQAGYYTDPANMTGTLLCGLRWYNPNLGRWLSRDPLGYAGGPNLYEYCASNPVMSLDPMGLDGDGLFDGYISHFSQFVSGFFKQQANAGVSDPLMGMIPGPGQLVFVTAFITGWQPFSLNTEDEQDGASTEQVFAFVAGLALPGGEVPRGSFGRTGRFNVARYAHLKDVKGVGPGKLFTTNQVNAIYAENMARNGGILKCDVTGETLVRSQRNIRGVHPPPNAAQVDHIIPRKPSLLRPNQVPGSNSYKNAQVISRRLNRIKSNF